MFKKRDRRRFEPKKLRSEVIRHCNHHQARRCVLREIPRSGEKAALGILRLARKIEIEHQKHRGQFVDPRDLKRTVGEAWAAFKLSRWPKLRHTTQTLYALTWRMLRQGPPGRLDVLWIPYYSIAVLHCGLERTTWP
jgi:hypothetical protein